MRLDLRVLMLGGTGGTIERGSDDDDVFGRSELVVVCAWNWFVSFNVLLDIG